MNPWMIYALIGLGAYYIGRQKGITDQKAVAAAGTNLLGQPVATTNALGGTSTIPGTSWVAQQNLGTSAQQAQTAIQNAANAAQGTTPSGQ